MLGEHRKGFLRKRQLPLNHLTVGSNDFVIELPSVGSREGNFCFYRKMMRNVDFICL